MNTDCLQFSGRNSYKWWQKEKSIKLIIIGIMLLIWLMIVVGLGFCLFSSVKLKDPFEVCIYTALRPVRSVLNELCDRDAFEHKHI